MLCNSIRCRATPQISQSLIYNYLHKTVSGLIPNIAGAFYKPSLKPMMSHVTLALPLHVFTYLEALSKSYPARLRVLRFLHLTKLSNQMITRHKCIQQNGKGCNATYSHVKDRRCPDPAIGSDQPLSSIGGMYLVRSRPSESEVWIRSCRYWNPSQHAIFFRAVIVQSATVTTIPYILELN